MIEGVTREGRKEQFSSGQEHAVLNGIGLLVRPRRQAQRIIRLPCIKLVTNKVESRQSSVHIQARDTQGVVMIPQTPGGHVVIIAESGGESARHISPLRPHNLIVWRVEKLRIAIKLKICVTAVQMRDNWYASIGNCVLCVSVEGIAPMQIGINRQQVLCNFIQRIDPGDLCFRRSSCQTALNLECPTGPG